MGRCNVSFGTVFYSFKKMLFVSDLEITAISALWAFVSGFPICVHYRFVAQNDVYVDLSPLWPVGHLL